MSPPAVLPSVSCHGVGTLIAIISQLNTLPACAPVNASMAASRLTTHDSGSGWLAMPFLCDSFIHYSTPVLSRRTTRAVRLWRVEFGAGERDDRETATRTEQKEVSGELLPEWTTSTSPCNNFLSNGDNPLNLLSQSRGSLQGYPQFGADDYKTGASLSNARDGRMQWE